MKIQDNEKKGTTKSAPNIEVGTGAAFSKSSYAAGREAASQAIASIGSHPLSAVFVFASALYHLDEMLSGIRSVVGEAPVFGASSVGEICGRIFSGSVVVMVLASPYLSVRMGRGTSVSAD